MSTSLSSLSPSQPTGQPDLLTLSLRIRRPNHNGFNVGGKGERMREGMCEASPPDLSVGPTTAGNDVSLCRTARINARLSLVFPALLVRQCRRRSWSPSLTSALVPSPRAPAMEAQPRLHVILNVREERQRQVQTTDARFSLVSLLRATPRTPPAPWCSAVCPMFVPPSFHAPRVCMCVFGACLGSLRFFLNLSFSVNTVSRHRTHSLISIPVVFPAKGIFGELSCVLAVLFSSSSPPSFSLSKLKAVGYSKGYRQ